MILSALSQLGLAGLNVTEADMQAGCKDVEAVLRDGSKRTVRLSTIVPDLWEDFLRRYVATSDGRVLIRPLLDKEFAGDDFLDALQPGSLAKLVNTACVLHMGIKIIRQAVAFASQPDKPQSN